MLVSAKTIFLPFIAELIVGALQPNDIVITDANGRNQSYDPSVFAFVFNSFPTAPSVLAFAIS
jgi:hypothetical protein